MFSDNELTLLNTRFEGDSPEVILAWAWDTFRSMGVAATSSFQSQSVPLLHIISKTVPDLPILFLDTGFHFPETLTFRDRLVAGFGLNIQNLNSGMKKDGFTRKHGQLYHTNPDLCCFINKVKPLKDAKKNLVAWVTGIRRDQTENRANTPVISIDGDGLYKICPMAAWMRKDIWRYIDEHQLPEHPLLAQGYMSVGCSPCTRPVFDGESDRDGRWAGLKKVECGIHLPASLLKERVDT